MGCSMIISSIWHEFDIFSIFKNLAAWCVIRAYNLRWNWCYIIAQSVGDIGSCLFLAGVCNAFYSSGFLLTTSLLLVDFPGTNMLIAVADELHMIHECPVLPPLRLHYAALFTQGFFLHNKITCRFSNLCWIVLTSWNFDFVSSSICG